MALITKYPIILHFSFLPSILGMRPAELGHGFFISLQIFVKVFWNDLIWDKAIWESKEGNSNSVVQHQMVSTLLSLLHSLRYDMLGSRRR